MLLILMVRGVGKNNTLHSQFPYELQKKKTLGRDLANLKNKEKGTHGRGFLILTICSLLFFFILYSDLL